MLKRLGQRMGLVAVIFCAINAQCALSCSLNLGMEPVMARSVALHASDSGHSCCRKSHTSVPPRSQEKQHQLCSEQVLTVANEIGFTQFDGLHFVGFASRHDTGPLVKANLVLRSTGDSPGTQHVPVCSILRV